jgi:hypothetical protein
VNYNYTYSYSTASAEIDSGVLIGMLIAILAFSVVLYVFQAIFLSKIFKKLGTEPAWSAWVPFYNIWKLLESGGQQGWWQFVPVANVIFIIIAAYNIGLKFGKSGGYVALYIFLMPIWLILLGINSAQPVKNAPQMNIVNTTTQPPAN